MYCLENYCHILIENCQKIHLTNVNEDFLMLWMFIDAGWASRVFQGYVQIMHSCHLCHPCAVRAISCSLKIVFSSAFDKFENNGAYYITAEDGAWMVRTVQEWHPCLARLNVCRETPFLLLKQACTPENKRIMCPTFIGQASLDGGWDVCLFRRVDFPNQTLQEYF